MHFSSETFYHTAGPSHKAWYWNHGLRWQTSLVWRSCGKWHANCSIRLLRCVLCWSTFFEHVVLSLVRPIVERPPFYIPDGSRFLKCNKNRCFFWSFHNLRKGILIFILLSCFKQCVLGLSGLLGLKAVIIFPLYCNAIIVWSLEMFCVVSQAFISMLAKRGTFLCVDVLGTTLMVC